MRYHLTLCALVLSAAALMRLTDVVEERAKDAAKAGASYSEALAMARIKLAAKAHNLRDESAFQQNLKWGLGNSVNSGLQGYLEPNVVDGLAIFTADCKVVARANLHTVPPIGCEAGTLNDSGALSWRSVSGKTTLVYDVPLMNQDGKNLRLAAETVIDHSWLINTPELKHQVDALNLSIGDEDGGFTGVVLNPDGLGSGGKHLAVLISQDRLLKAIPRGWLRHAPGTREAAWVLMLAAGALAVLLALEKIQAARLQKGASKKYRELERELSRREDGIAELKEKNETLANTILRLEGAIQALETEQADHSRLKTMALQLNSSTNGFIAGLFELEAISEAMNSEIGQHLVARATALADLAESWREGMAQSSPRKFLRTLDERPTKTGTELTDQVALIHSLSRSLGRVAFDLGIKTEAMARGARSVKDVASFWQSLEQIVPDGGEQWLLDLVIEAQGLVATVARRPVTAFNNTVDAELTVNHLGMPKSFWVSVLYHLFSAVVPDGETQATVATKLARREGETFLIIAIKDDSGKPRRPKDAMRHWNLAERLVKPSTVKLAVLPTIGEVKPIALHWPLTGLPAESRDPKIAPIMRPHSEVIADLS